MVTVPQEPSKDLLRLVTRVENRQWLEEEIVNAKERLKEVRADIRFTHHAPDCARCLIEIQLDIERYAGRMCPWYLQIMDELAFDGDDEFWEGLPDYYKDFPRVTNYRIGSYCSGMSEDTMRFIKDRLKWAQNVLVMEVKTIKTYLKALQKCDLESPLPPSSIF